MSERRRWRILVEGDKLPISDDDDEEDTEYHAASWPRSMSLDQRDILVQYG